jgi:Flp pilus assembly protein TadG
MPNGASLVRYHRKLLARQSSVAGRLLRDRAGVIAIQTVVVATALIGIAGLSVDVGSWYFTHRSMQTAADAAAIAGALELAGNKTTSEVIAAADVDATRNGYGTSNGASVGVEIGSDSESVTVTVAKTGALFLAGMFLPNGQAPGIQTAAKAGLIRNGGPVCILATSPTGAGAISVGGNAVLNTAGCSIVSDSTDPQALIGSGNASITSDKTCGPGGYSAAQNVTFTPPPSHCLAVPDPYAGLPPPPNVNADCDYQNLPNVSGTATLSPGVYCGGITISSNANVIFLPGVYIMRNGGLSASGNASMSGNGVGFYLTGDSTVNVGQDDLTVSGNAVVRFTAPDSGPLKGFIVYQNEPNASAGQITSSITGNGNVSYAGALYFGNQNVSIDGNGASGTNQPFASVVANQITISGNGTVNFNSQVSPPPGLQLTSVALLQ